MGHHIAVILLLGVLTTGAMLGIAMQRDSNQADKEVADYEFDLLARDASISGLQLTVRKLADSYNMGSWTGGTYFNNVSYASGRFTTTVTVSDPVSGGTSGDTVDVVSRGYQGPAVHVIYARYARDKDDKGIPPAFKHALISDFYMQIDGNMLIAAINNGFNASIHTNDDLTVQGNSFLVEGFGTYTGDVSINAQGEDNFAPNIDYNGDDPNHHWSDSVKVPQLDWDRLYDRSTTTSGGYVEQGGPSAAPLVIDNAVIDFTNPDASFWTDYGITYTCPTPPCGNEDNPFVLYVNGPVELKNTVEIVGNGFVAATGDVSVAPQGTGGGVYGALNENQETTVVLATKTDMYVGKAGGNTCMGLGPASYTDNSGSTRSNNHCQSTSGEFDSGISLYVEDEIRFKGTPFIVGGVVAHKATFEGGGNPWITYASANEGTLDAGFEYIVPIGPILIAFSEF